MGGNLTVELPSAPAANIVDLNYKFAGMEYDPETAEYHTLSRQYASNLGRWASPDPVRGRVDFPQGQNLYAYVLNNPTNRTDPLGLNGGSWWPWPCFTWFGCPPAPCPGPPTYPPGGGGPTTPLRPSPTMPPEPTGVIFLTCPAGWTKVTNVVQFIACLGTGGFPLFAVGCGVAAASCVTAPNPVSCLGAIGACGITLGQISWCAHATTKCVRNPIRRGGG